MDEDALSSQATSDRATIIQPVKRVSIFKTDHINNIIVRIIFGTHQVQGFEMYVQVYHLYTHVIGVCPTIYREIAGDPSKRVSTDAADVWWQGRVKVRVMTGRRGILLLAKPLVRFRIDPPPHVGRPLVVMTQSKRRRRRGTNSYVTAA